MNWSLRIAFVCLVYVVGACNWPDDQEIYERCRAMPIEDCESDEQCAVDENSVYDEDATCWDREVTHCSPRDLYLEQRAVYARGPDGRCWSFFANNIPPGDEWEISEEVDDACGDLAGEDPFCDPPTSSVDR